MLRALLLTILTLTSTSCKTPGASIEDVLPVPRMSQAGKAELRAGQCPAANEWLRFTYTPWACELRSHGDDPCKWEPNE